MRVTSFKSNPVQSVGVRVLGFRSSEDSRTTAGFG